MKLNTLCKTLAVFLLTALFLTGGGVITGNKVYAAGDETRDITVELYTAESLDEIGNASLSNFEGAVFTLQRTGDDAILQTVQTDASGKAVLEDVVFKADELGRIIDVQAFTLKQVSAPAGYSPIGAGIKFGYNQPGQLDAVINFAYTEFAVGIDDDTVRVVNVKQPSTTTVRLYYGLNLASASGGYGAGLAFDLYKKSGDGWEKAIPDIQVAFHKLDDMNMGGHYADLEISESGDYRLYQQKTTTSDRYNMLFDFLICEWEVDLDQPVDKV
ncbi:MAG: prealbumin-like fold domain-containing protein, partial [Clostridiales bacterium]|nr:prealbumin-like fold domain-containing protein [Clostridiales bacterium]